MGTAIDVAGGGPGDENTLGFCDVCECELIPGPKWYHRVGGSDLCYIHWFDLKGHDRTSYRVVYNPAQLGGEMHCYRMELQQLYVATQRGDVDLLRRAVHVAKQRGVRGSALVNAVEALSVLEARAAYPSFDSRPVSAASAISVGSGSEKSSCALVGSVGSLESCSFIVEQ